MTMTILQGWPEDEPILELPVDDWDGEAALRDESKNEGDLLAGLLDEVSVPSAQMGQVQAIVRRSGLASIVGALLGV